MASNNYSEEDHVRGERGKLSNLLSFCESAGAGGGYYPVDFYNPVYDPSSSMTLNPSSPPITTDGQRTTSVIIDNIRRRHGFLQHGESGENLLFNHSSSSNSSDISNEFGGQRIRAKLKDVIPEFPELGSEVKQNHGGVGLIFLKRFLKINFMVFNSTVSTLLFVFLVLLCLLGEYFIYQIGLVPGKYYKVLGEKDIHGFWIHTAISLGIIVSIAMVKSTKDYVCKLLTVTWREILCRKLHQMYFSKIHYYQLNVLDKIIDNPDQRLTQDVDKFTSIYGEILPKFIIAPFVIAYYSYQAFAKAGWYGPVGCFGFFFVGSLINRLAMLPVVKYVVEQEKKEGDFRFIHMLIRVNAESIAFGDGSCREGSKANESLDELIRTQSRLYIRQFILNICINLFDYLGSILSYVILAITIFSGAYDSLSPTDLSVVISQNSFVNMYLIYQFSQLVDLSIKVAEVIGITHRVSQLLERLGQLNEIYKDLFPFQNEERRDYKEFENYRLNLNQNQMKILLPAWELKNVSYSPPFRDQVLVSDLSMTIYAGESLLIVGSSSAGKSTLLRILRGLWPPTHGRLYRFHPPGPSYVFYSPQKPYLAVGTLREQVTFPLTPSSDTNQLTADSESILHYINFLQLSHVLDRVGGIDIPVSWTVYESLSPGEIQRLCFLRVFFHKPIIAILDESTSALPISMEDLIYTECQRLGITTISVAHRDSVKKFHEKILSLHSDGGWSLEEL